MAYNIDSSNFIEKLANANDFLQAKSIAEQARDNIFMYKVGMSQSIGDVKLAVAINKYIETMCCIFTLIVSGINPIVKNNKDIKNVIEKISAESIDPAKISLENMSILDKIKHLSIEYSIPDEDIKQFPRIGKYAHSTEAVAGRGRRRVNVRTHTTTPAVQQKWFVDPKFSEKLDKYPAYPTILKITFNVQGGSIIVPIAVKATPTSIGSEEMKMFIESVLAGRSFKFIRYFKWKSGEISTLEYIFGLDVAKRDKKLYQSLGRNPIYIEFMNRKAKSKFFGSLDLIASKNKQGNTIGPTGSLVVTTDDLVESTNLDIRRFTKDNELIKRIMQETFIMCFAIVDVGMEVVSFYFMGYNEPFRVNFAELGVGTAINSDKQLEQAILELSRKVS
jgi:hypothetical protein